MLEMQLFVIHHSKIESLNRSAQIITMLYILVSQFRGGSITKGSELQIEVAEFLWKDVQVKTIY